MVTPFCLTIIKTFEKFEPRPYLCAGGKWTIGYGHVIKDPTDRTWRDPLSRETADIFLADDVGIAARAVRRYVERQSLLTCQYEALVSWTFNLGSGNLSRSTMLTRLIEGDEDGVVSEMIRWCNAGGERLDGLVRRRHCEAVWYMGAPDEIVLALARKAWK